MSSRWRGQPPRISRDDLFMEVAKLFGKRSTCPRAEVGAVLVRDRRIVGSGYVGAPPGQPHCKESGCDIRDGGCSRTIHAEANAIAWAARAGIRTEDCALYSTYSPCPQCAKLLLSAGITEVTYLNRYRDQLGITILERSGVLVRAFEPVRQKANLDPTKKLELH